MRSYLDQLTAPRRVTRCIRAGRPRDGSDDRRHSAGWRQRMREVAVEPTELAGLAETLYDPAPSPEDQLIHQEDVHRLRAALGELPARERRVVGWVLEEVPEAEMARRLGVNVRTVERVKRSALELLREALGDE